MICNPHLPCAQLRCVTRYLRGRWWVLSGSALTIVDCSLLMKLTWRCHLHSGLGAKKIFASYLWYRWLLWCAGYKIYVCCYVFLCYSAMVLCYSTYVICDDACFMSYELLRCYVHGVLYHKFWEHILTFDLSFCVLDLENCEMDFWGNVLVLE